MGIIRFVLIGAVVCSAAAFGEVALVLQSNMDELRCEMPNKTCRFVGSSAPGQIFLPDEPANIRLVLKKGTDNGPVDFSIEIQEIGTRTPGRVVQRMEGFTDTAGHAPLIDLIGKPSREQWLSEVIQPTADSPGTPGQRRTAWPVPACSPCIAAASHGAAVRFRVQVRGIPALDPAS